MATVRELRAQAKARKIPKYYRLSKPQLMSALGVTNQSARPLGDARARSTAKQHGIAKTYAADKLSSKLGGSDEAKKVAIKQRIVKSVSKELKAHEKKIGRKLTIEEKRTVAVKALSKEVKAIRSGMPEQGGKAKKAAAETLAKNRADHLADPKSQELMMNFRAHAERTRAARKAEKEKAEKAPKATESKAKESGLDFLHSPETAVTAGETVHGTGINEGVRHSLILKQPKEHGGDILNWKASTKIGLPATAVSRINNLPGHSKEWSSYSGKQKAEQLEDSLNHLSVLQGKFDPKLIKDPQLHEKYKAASEHIASSMFDRMSEKEKHDWADSMHDRSQRFGSVTKSPIVQRIQTEMNGRADKIEEKHYADRKAAKKAGAGKKPPEDDLFATKAVKRSKAKAEPIAKKATSEDKPWDRKLTREEIAKKRKENEKLRKTRTDSFFDENSHHSPAF